MTRTTRRAAAALLALAAAGSLPAATSVIGNGSAEIYVGAGASNFVLDTVFFNVPGAQVGNGQSVAGVENNSAPSSLIDASARAPGGSRRTAVWTVDSSAPLRCATPASCGVTTVPLTRFRWVTVSGNEIASGSFTGSVSQPLHTFDTSRYVSVYKIFHYLNDEILPAGRYTGRVVYTLTMP